jgi:ATP-dependent protease ClpP protease subunit
MKLNSIMLVSTFFAVPLCAPLHAEDSPNPLFAPMSFTFEDGLVKAIGTFEWDSSDKFRTFLTDQNKQSEDWNVPVLLRSPGGDIEEALKIGHLIREHQMSTVTDTMCASACTYTFMGGVHRVAAEGTQYGVHQFYGNIVFTDYEKQVYSAKDLVEAQQRTSRLQNYATDMGVDNAVVALALNTSPIPTEERPQGVYVLSRQQLLTYKVENVPTTYPNGQPLENLNIPGVFPPAGQTFDLESLAIPDTSEVSLSSVSELLAKNFISSLFAAYEGTPEDVGNYVDNNFAYITMYKGHAVGKDNVVKDKIKYTKKWAFRKYEIDDNTVQIQCETDTSQCRVSGEAVIKLGLIAGKSNFKNRYKFDYTVFAPGQSPRIMLENIQAMN